MSDEKLPWMKFNATEFMGDGSVGMMTATERGIYISLLCHAWTEGGVPDNRRRMAIIANATVEEVEAAWEEVLSDCFEPHPRKDGYLIQPRMEKDRQEALELRRKRSEAGRKGARAKHGKDKGSEGGGAGGTATGTATGTANGDAAGKATGEAGGNHASGNLSSSSVDSTYQEEEEHEKEEDPVRWMHEVWHEELGIDGHEIQLTDKRKTKYRKMYEEQLEETKDPERAWRLILRRVQMSDHHMSERSYQMPESLLRNAERRETWVQRTLEAARSGRNSPRRRKRQAKKDRMYEAIDEVEAVT